MVGTNSLASPISASCLISSLNNALKYRLKIALDVNWRATFWDERCEPGDGPSATSLSLIQPLLSSVSFLKLAKEESLWLFGTCNPTSISESLPLAPHVVVTDGANPVHWHIYGQSGTFLPFLPSKVVDTTGAGDAFTSALIHKLVLTPGHSSAPESFVRFASACGSLVCESAGAIDSQPDLMTVNKYLYFQHSKP